VSVAPFDIALVAIVALIGIANISSLLSGNKKSAPASTLPMRPATANPQQVNSFSTQQQMQAQQRTNALTAQYSDVFAHPKAAGFAIRRMQDAIDDGHPDNPETVAEVMKQARAKYGIGTRRPDPSLRTKLSGMPASGGGRGGPTKLHLTEVEKGMADALYGKSIPDDEARWKHYAKTIAVRAREEEG